MAEKKTASLPEGWTWFHEQDALIEGGILIKSPNYIAHKRHDSSMVEAQGETRDQVVERAEAWESGQPAPNPATEDGNRELSDEEKIESAKATAMGQVTQGAKVGGHVDLTPAAKKSKAKAAIVSVKPNVDHEVVTGEAAEDKIVSGPKSTTSG